MKELTSVSLEGCTAPRRDKAQLHAAVVEIVVKQDAEVKYSTVQTGIPATKTETEAFIILLQRGDYVKGLMQNCSGPRLKQGLQLLGNIQAQFLEEIIQHQNFIALLLPTTGSRRIPGQRCCTLGKIPAAEW